MVCAIQESVATLLLDAKALKNPVTHVSQVGSVVLLPTVFVNLPGGHLVCATQESVTMVLFDDESVKNPVAHTSHVGCVVALPIAFVYLPGGHLVWAIHPSGQPVGKGQLAIVCVIRYGCLRMDIFKPDKVYHTDQ